MQLATATQAGELAAKVAVLTQLIARIDVAIAEAWPLTVMRGAAPPGSEHAGSECDLLPFGPADAPTSALAWSTARTTYQGQLDAANAELAAL